MAVCCLNRIPIDPIAVLVGFGKIPGPAIQGVSQSNFYFCRERRLQLAGFADCSCIVQSQYPKRCAYSPVRVDLSSQSTKRFPCRSIVAGTPYSRDNESIGIGPSDILMEICNCEQGSIQFEPAVGGEDQTLAIFGLKRREKKNRRAPPLSVPRLRQQDPLSAHILISLMIRPRRKELFLLPS